MRNDHFAVLWQLCNIREELISVAHLSTLPAWVAAPVVARLLPGRRPHSSGSVLSCTAASVPLVRIMQCRIRHPASQVVDVAACRFAKMLPAAFCQEHQLASWGAVREYNLYTLQTMVVGNTFRFSFAPTRTPQLLYAIRLTPLCSPVFCTAHSG